MNMRFLRALLKPAVLVVVIFGALAVYWQYRQGKNAELRVQLLEQRTRYRYAQQNQRGDILQDAEAHLESLAREYTSYAAGQEAALLLAGSLYIGAVQGDTNALSRSLDLYTLVADRRWSPLRAFGTLGLAKTYESLGQYQDAYDAYEQTYALGSSSGLQAYALWGMGRVAMVQNNMTNTTRVWAQLAEQFPKSVWNYYAMAQRHYYETLVAQQLSNLTSNTGATTPTSNQP